VKPPHPQLRDDVVALRPWRDADVPSMFHAFSDPVVQRFSWPHTEPYTEGDAWAYLAETKRAWEAGTSAEFACVAPADDKAILGGASVYDIEADERQASVGYWVAAHARGHGVATHATKLLATWAFDTLEIERLQLTCGPDNFASQRVAERAAFTREALLRSHLPFKGGRRDTVVFGLVRTVTARPAAKLAGN
jgi:RimJ/RimL family protein N-acetyltransferase